MANIVAVYESFKQRLATPNRHTGDAKKDAYRAKVEVLVDTEHKGKVYQRIFGAKVTCPNKGTIPCMPQLAARCFHYQEGSDFYLVATGKGPLAAEKSAWPQLMALCKARVSTRPIVQRRRAGDTPGSFHRSSSKVMCGFDQVGHFGDAVPLPTSARRLRLRASPARCVWSWAVVCDEPDANAATEDQFPMTVYTEPMLRLFVGTPLVPTLGLLLAATAPAMATPVTLKTLSATGGMKAPLVRRFLLSRLGDGKSCVKIGVRISFSAHISKTGKVKLTKVAPAHARRCLQRKLRRLPSRRTATTVDASFAWRAPTAREQRSLRRRELLAAKIAKLGMLKLLGTRGGPVAIGRLGSGGPLSGSIRAGGLRMGRGTSWGRGMGGGGYGYGRARYRQRVATRAARRVANAKQRKQALKKALRLPRWRGKPASWWQEEPSGTSWWRPVYGPRALGPDLAIVGVVVKHQARRAKAPGRTMHHVLLDRQRVAGTLRFPTSPKWLGIDATRHIYFVDEAGQLFAATMEQALAGTFSQRARVPSGRWEASGSRIAVLAAGQLRLSKDGGRRFVPITAPKALGATKVQDFALRPDGLLAVIFEAATGGTRTLQLTRDDGKSWVASSFQPPSISRIGGLISASHGCGSAVLAADGRRWISASLPSTGGWAVALKPRGSYGHGGFASDATPAPKVTARAKVITATKPEACRGGGGGGGLLGGFGTSGATGCRRSGFKAQCLRGSVGRRRPVGSFLAAYQLRHGANTVAFVDHRTGALTFGTLPKTCPRPQRSEFVPGSTLLLCPHAEGPLGEARTELFFATAGGSWKRDGVLPARSVDLRPSAFANDGTLLLQACDYNSQRQLKEGNGYLCARAWVRKPAPLGTPNAWREVRRTDMLAYRPLPGGRALLIDRAADKNTAIQLYIESPKRIRPFGPPIPITRDYQNVTIEERTIRFHDRRGRFILLPKGALASFPRD